MSERTPRLYSEFASWWQLLSTPADYAEEAEFCRRAIADASAVQPITMLELGSGGGNNASHLKSYFRITLLDISADMLAVSRTLNPECEHIQGDMRNIRLGRVFDAVFIHDAISYMSTEDDLSRAIETAFVHCRHGGVALFAPDYTRESFRTLTSHGGHDGERRGMRYLEWVHDPDPADTSYTVDFAYLLREGNEVRCQYDRHICGLFGREDWLRFIGSVGFSPRVMPFEHSEIEPGSSLVFLGVKPDR
ncbi:MAG: class I SAM-dependent methyltransferase [Dehalococcoidia bacterium]